MWVNKVYEGEYSIRSVGPIVWVNKVYEGLYKVCWPYSVGK